MRLLGIHPAYVRSGSFSSGGHASNAGGMSASLRLRRGLGPGFWIKSNRAPTARTKRALRQPVRVAAFRLARTGEVVHTDDLRTTELIRPKSSVPGKKGVTIPRRIMAIPPSSGIVLAETDGFTTKIWGARMMVATGAMSRMKLKLSLS